MTPKWTTDDVDFSRIAECSKDELLRDMMHILFRDMDAESECEFWNPDKDWGSDIISLIGDWVDSWDLVPPEPERGE